MKATPNPTPARRRARSLAGGLALAVMLLGLAGCGQRYIAVELDRPENLPQPVWVGVYFLSQESALENYSNAELATESRVEGADGVVHERVFAIKPGDRRQIELQEYDERIGWVEVAAGLPDRCARQRIAVESGAKLRIMITVTETCIELTTD